MSALLEMKGVRSFIGKHEVICGASLEILEGELVCLLGANGAGKSSLFKTISGIIRPSDGTITYEGELISKKGADRIEAKKIAYHNRVRAGYLKLAAKYPGRIKIVKVDGEIPEVQLKIRTEVDNVIC